MYISSEKLLQERNLLKCMGFKSDLVNLHQNYYKDQRIWNIMEPSSIQVLLSSIHIFFKQ